MNNLFNNENKAKAKSILAKATSHICADLHLIAKSTADGIVKAEASIVNRLTGQEKDSIIEDRHNKTEETQDQFKDIAETISNEFNRGAKTIKTSFGKFTRVEPTVVMSEAQTFNND